MKNSFFDVRCDEKSEKWEMAIKREIPIYLRNDIRSEFERDYTRILHCDAYRRLKHKTQVFYNIENDDIGIVDISAQNGLDLVFQSGRYKDYSAVAYVEVDENGRFNIIETPDEALA